MAQSKFAIKANCPFVLFWIKFLTSSNIERTFSQGVVIIFDVIIVWGEESSLNRISFGGFKIFVKGTFILLKYFY